MILKTKTGPVTLARGEKTEAQALSVVIAALQSLLENQEAGLRPLLEVVRVAFGMDYASAWARREDGWRCTEQTGSLGRAFADLTERFLDRGDSSQG